MNKQQFNHFKNQGYNNIPVFKELILDTDTALGLYLKVANNNYSYLFESVEGGQKWGRYSIIGLQSNTIIKVFDDTVLLNNEEVSCDNPLDWIEQYQAQFNTPNIEELENFSGGLVGYFGYETIRYIEPKLANIGGQDALKTPDILLMLSQDVVVFDNLKNKVFIITHINPNTQSFDDGIAKITTIQHNIYNNPIPESSPHTTLTRDNFVSNFGENNFKLAVDKIKEYITRGDCMQVVPSQRLVADFEGDAMDLYRKLRIVNPSPYMYYLNLEDFHIVGSSPEILAKVDKKGKAVVRPLAGTRPRGKDEAQDKALEEELLADEKEIAEHLMLIDLGRNDLGRIAEIGKVEVTDKIQIERYSHVMHIVSNVEAVVKSGLSNIDVLKATFPAGTLSGAPKIRAMEIIDEVEHEKRGIYSGAVGYLGFNGEMDTAIAIRTAIITNKKLFVQAGAGVVFDSDPQKEWEETMHKAGALINSATNL
jgi:anthranilate synthase component 1